jgi:hypothetical protein
MRVRARVLDMIRGDANKSFTAADLLMKLHAIASRDDLALALRRLCHEGLIEKVVRGHAGIAATYRAVVPPEPDGGYPQGAA